MNILICSAGRRVKLINYFREELQNMGGKVLAIDCDSKAPALYFADSYEVVPRIDDHKYLHVIERICKKHQINGLFSLIDPELTLLAKNKAYFEGVGIQVITSDYEVINYCYDKYLTYKTLTKHQIPCVKTYIDLNEVQKDLEKGTISFPLMVKPRRGSASVGIKKVSSIKELYVLFQLHEDLVVQPFIDGDEYGVDCYIDMIHHGVTNIFIKQKMMMRAGETDKSLAVKTPELTAIIQKLTSVINFTGPIDIDCFKTEEGYFISEINPRFGGGYPHAHELGQNFPRKIINNIQGIPNQVEIGNYEEGSILIKYENHRIIHKVGEVFVRSNFK